MSLRRLRRRLAHWWSTRGASVHPRPILVLGNQKSGTSAIGALLARATGLPGTIDIPGIHGDVQRALHAGELAFDAFVERNRLEFSRPIIKEPALTFLYPQLEARFPGTPMVMVVRDPRHNLRSILNRLELPGDLDALSDAELDRVGAVGPNWRRMLEGWLGAEGDHYVTCLARRWNVAADVYLERPERMTLLRYEDFLADKERAIADLARSLGLEPRHSIAADKDRAFQPRGDRSVTPEAFFGDRNLERVLTECGARMATLSYAT